MNKSLGAIYVLVICWSVLSVRFFLVNKVRSVRFSCEIIWCRITYAWTIQTKFKRVRFTNYVIIKTNKSRFFLKKFINFSCHFEGKGWDLRMKSHNILARHFFFLFLDTS